MSSFVKYNLITDYLNQTILATTGFENFTIFIGDPVQTPERPYARISLDSFVTENDGFGQLPTTVRINLGIEALYQPESTFLANLDVLITEINDNAATICGVEFCHVAGARFGSEDAQYSRCIIIIESTYY